MTATHKVSIEIEFVARGFESLNHNLMMFRTSLETDMPFVLGKITKFQVEELSQEETKKRMNDDGK